MIEKLHIQNYRLFKDLKIEKLSQINLIGGKNNSGKTALLEALMILTNEGGSYIFSFILNQRDEITTAQPEDGYNLFNDRNNEIVSISDNNYAYKFGVKKAYKDDTILSPFQYGINKTEIAYFPINKSIYVPIVSSLEFDSRLWDNISLTRLENDVIDILKIVEPRLEKFRFDNKKSKILIEGQDYPIPLKKAGEGINRLLSIALALVNAKNKILLIDEFEVGLHHSIQKQLWKIIFEYAKKWDIQVFITTHSLDTVRSFAEVLDEYEGMGQYMRLQKSRLSGDIEAVVYDKKSLDISIEQNFETR